MTDDEYRQALSENPELYWHPEFINSPNCPSRDFKYMESYQPIDDGARNNSISGASAQQSFYSTRSKEIGNSHLSKGYLNSVREGSVYLEAYTGDDELDKIATNQNSKV